MQKLLYPAGFDTFREALRAGVEVFHALKKVVKGKGYETGVGDEGGFAPSCKHGNEEPLELIEEAVKNAGYVVGKQIFLGMDVASSEFYDPKTGKYTLEKSGEGSYDSRFGKTPGTYQHLDMVRRYAIESGLPVIRANYSGISAFVLSNGEVLSSLPIGQVGTLDGTVWGAHKTIYRAIGRDWMMIIILLVVCCGVMATGNIRKSK